MNRRQLMVTSAALMAASVTPTFAADSVTHVTYSRAEYEKALASGKPFMLDFYASW